FFCDTPTLDIYSLSLHDALPIFTVAAQNMPKLIRHPVAGGGFFAHDLINDLRNRIGNRWVELRHQRHAVTDVRQRQFLLVCAGRSEEHTSELQSRENLVCRLLLE